MLPPVRFHYQPFPPTNGQWHVRPAQDGPLLGSVAALLGDEWIARVKPRDEPVGGFRSRRCASVWLWHKAVDRLGHDALGKWAMDPNPTAPKTPFLDVVQRAGLTLSMAARIARVNPRTGRRWATVNDPNDHRSLLRDAAMVKLEALAVENEKALAAENQGKSGKRPLRARAIAEAMAFEQENRERRRADGVAPVHRGNGPLRMQKQAERSLRRLQARNAAREASDVSPI